MLSTHVNYKEIKFNRTIKLICKLCKKKVQRKFSDYYTHNPFNTKSDEECKKNCHKRIDRDILRARLDGVICRACERDKEF